jgi:hypothetical protein
MSRQEEFGEQNIASMLKNMEEAKKYNEQARQAYLAQDYRFIFLKLILENYLGKQYNFIIDVCFLPRPLYN